MQSRIAATVSCGRDFFADVRHDIARRQARRYGYDAECRLSAILAVIF